MHLKHELKMSGSRRIISLNYFWSNRYCDSVLSQTTDQASVNCNFEIAQNAVFIFILVLPEGRFRDLLRPFLGQHLRVACSPGGSRKLPEALPTLPAPLPVVRLEPKLSSSPSGGDRSFCYLPLLLAVAGLPVRPQLAIMSDGSKTNKSLVLQPT
jgi:hypothetical protein